MQAGTGAASAPIALPMVYTVFMNANPYLIALVGFGFVVGQLAFVPIYFTLITRLLFAYSFDRLLPSKFADVSPRFDVPIISTLVALAIGLTTRVVVNEYSAISTWTVNVTVGLTISLVIISIAAIKFPYGKTKANFEASHPIVKLRIGKIPLMAIAGTVSLVTLVYATYAGLTIPAIGGRSHRASSSSV